MVAQGSEKNSKRDEIGLFAEPVEGPENQSTKGRGTFGLQQPLISLFVTTVWRPSLLPSKA